MRASGFVVARTPLLPFDAVSAWSDGVRSIAALGSDDDVLRQALEYDRRLLAERLARLVLERTLKEALSLASPSLAAVLDAPETARFGAATGTFVRYFLRLSARATPFGLMAGMSAGAIGARTRLALGPRARYRRRTSLDGAALGALGRALVNEPTVRRETAFHPNPDLYELAGELRFFVAAKDDAHSFRLNAVESSRAVTSVLRAAAGGGRPEAIAERASGRGRDPRALRTLVDALIDARLLVSELDPPVTGSDPLAALEATLKHAGKAARKVALKLGGLRAALAETDAKGLVPSKRQRADLDARLSDVPGLAVASLQVDLWKPAPGLCLGTRAAAEVLAGVRVLQRVGQSSSDADLVRFREAFERRYGTRKIRLVDALDPEHGIGFPPVEPQARPLRAALLQLAERAWTQGQREIALTPSDVDALASAAGNAAPPLPDAMAALVSIAAGSDAAVDRGDFRFLLHSVHGPSGARLLGRACLLDAGLHAEVLAHVRAEERLRPGAVWAELVVLPKQRHRNVMARPVLREHEVSFACRSGADLERRIALGDLWLALDGDRVVLGSQRLGREVVPRISCALNWAHPEGHAFFRLLGALQSQGRADALAFDWGALETAAFLPRVRAGRAVLSLARWRIAGDRLRRTKTESETAAFRRIQQVRETLGLPRFVSLTNDTPLVLDLNNALCIEELERSARSSDTLCITEVFPEPAELGVRGREGRFAHELVVPFVATTPPEPASRFSVPRSATPAKRVRLPGSDWLYVKVYVTPAAGERLLGEELAPFVARALRSRAIERWFFVRYSDPEPHLRLRLHGSPRRLLREVWPALSAVLARRFDGHTVFRVELATYEREVERYGGPRALELVERIFWRDSECALALLATPATLAGRVQLALVGVDRLLAAFGLDHGERRRLVAKSRDALARELDAASARDERGAFFRAERAAIAELLRGGGLDRAALRAFERRDATSRQAVRRLRALERARTLQIPLARVLESVVHLHVNRLFATAQRRRELEVLDALERHYRTLGQRR